MEMPEAKMLPFAPRRRDAAEPAAGTAALLEALRRAALARHDPGRRDSVLWSAGVLAGWSADVPPARSRRREAAEPAAGTAALLEALRRAAFARLGRGCRNRQGDDLLLHDSDAGHFHGDPVRAGRRGLRHGHEQEGAARLGDCRRAQRDESAEVIDYSYARDHLQIEAVDANVRVRSRRCSAGDELQLARSV